MEQHKVRARVAARFGRDVITRSGLFDEAWYLARYPDVAGGGFDAVDHYLRHGADEGRDPSPVFETAFYIAQYPGLDPLCVNPLCHYVAVGEDDGAWPNRFFDPAYVRASEATLPAGQGALLARYLAAGADAPPPCAGFVPSPLVRADGRLVSASPLVAALASLGAAPALAPRPPRPAPVADAVALNFAPGGDLVEAAAIDGRRRWRVTGADPYFVLTPRSGVLAAGHYRLYFEAGGLPLPGAAAKLYIDSGAGWSEEEAAPLFIEPAGAGFVSARATLPVGARALRFDPVDAAPPEGAAEFAFAGAFARRIGRIAFYTGLMRDLGGETAGAAGVAVRTVKTALAAGPAKAAADLRAQDAARRPAPDPPPPPVVEKFSAVVARQSVLVAPGDLDGKDVAIFVAFAPNGICNELQQEQISFWREAGYFVIVILNAGLFDPLTDPETPPLDGLIVRENVGYDFGAWACALNTIGGLECARSITLVNDSVYPVTGARGLSELRTRVADRPEDVLSATRNLEVAPHLQSYFLAFKRNAIEAGALDLIRSVPAYVDKECLIHEVEIPLAEKVAALGLIAAPLFDIPEAVESGRNPTVHHWKELLAAGFPFWKVQLLTAEIVSHDDPDAVSILGDQLLARLVRHATARSEGVKPAATLSAHVEPAFSSNERYNEYGAQNAWNPPAALLRPVAIPFRDTGHLSPSSQSILAVVHCFYLDVAQTILDELAALKIAMRLILTTDEESKARELRRMLSERGLSGKAVVTPNRGRDVAPFLVETFRDGGDEDLILHLHTKKSTHDDRYAGWGDHLRACLIGGPDKVSCILALLLNETIGLVYAEHFREVASLRNWGFDFDKARGLLDRLGVAVNADTLLEFPTSTMFWARREVLAPLLELGLDYDDFDPEEGQVDGTLAHAIERILLYLCEKQGYRFVKVVDKDAPPDYLQNAVNMNPNGLTRFLGASNIRLLGNEGGPSSFSRKVGEVYPVHFSRSPSPRRRLNLLIPTLKPEKIYGGVSTAVASFRALAEAASLDTDVRAIVTSDDADAASVRELSSRLGKTVTRANVDADVAGATVIDLPSQRSSMLPLRAGDVFFATAWWTADLAFRARDRQQDMFAAPGPVIYLIQDFEPGFYGWSNHYALAEATYFRGEEALALINSEELFAFMTGRYRFRQAWCVPYELNARIADRLRPTIKERILLCYGRPSTPRNCFDLVVEGLRLWRRENLELAKAWRVVFAGEGFDAHLIADLPDAEIAGKMPIDDYADLLNKAAVGVSLMVSPHPSYPPLEMASAGMQVVANAYEGKDLSLRAPNIRSVYGLNPQALAAKIGEAVIAASPGRIVAPVSVGAPHSVAPTLRWRDVVDSIW